jgi:mono/diheme cytochrome c family protein
MGGKGGSGMDWSGGDPTLGKSEYDAKCVRCHGPAGKGGQVPEVGLVPDITTVAMGQRLGDAQVASVVAHGRGKMPSFADGLDGARLKAIVAYVRTLKP